MKKSFNKKAAILPLPVYIIATYDKEGTPNAMNAAWGTQWGYNEIFFILDSEHKTTENIKLNKAFTVSFGTRNTADIADFFGVVSGKDVDKISKAGVTVVKSNHVNAPVIEQFPLTLECRVVSITDEDGDSRVVGEVLNMLVDEEFLDEKGKINVDKLELISFDSVTNSYRIIGEKVGNAFKDGLKLKY